MSKYHTGVLDDKYFGVDLKIGLGHPRSSKIFWLNYDVKSSRKALQDSLSHNSKTKIPRSFIILPRDFMKRQEEVTHRIAAWLKHDLKSRQIKYFEALS